MEARPARIGPAPHGGADRLSDEEFERRRREFDREVEKRRLGERAWLTLVRLGLRSE